MRQNHCKTIFRISLVVAFLCPLAAAQIKQPHDGDMTVVITPVAPPDKISASIDVFAQCTPTTGPSLLKPQSQNSVADKADVRLALAAKLSSGTTVCAVETFVGTGAPAPKVFDALTVQVAQKAAPPKPTNVTLQPVTTAQTTVYVTPIPPPAGDTATLDIYAVCPPPAKTTPLEDATVPATVDGSGSAVALQLLAAPKSGDKLCAEETYAGGKSLTPTDSDPVTVADPPTPPATKFRNGTSIFAAVAGVDISGASSTNEQAVFHGSAVFDVPMTKGTGWIQNAKWWLGGQARIAGIAQPGTLTGAIGSLASASTYLATAINATPDKIVQSVEVSADLAYTIRSWPTDIDSLDTGTDSSTAPKFADTFPTIISVSALINMGAITPLSASQANPTVFTVTNQIYQTYGPPSYPTSPPIPASCNPSATPTPAACYLAFIPQDRNRFYRHYEGGFRMKVYGRDFSDGEYRFPAIVDLTFGQNEYVTGGKARGVVMHLGGWIPVPKVDCLYIFGSMDTTLGPATEGSQLVLVPAPSTTTLTYTSSSVYPVSVPQPNRDRYMVGFGIDLYHLISKLQPAKMQ